MNLLESYESDVQSTGIVNPMYTKTHAAQKWYCWTVLISEYQETLSRFMRKSSSQNKSKRKWIGQTGAGNLSDLVQNNSNKSNNNPW